MKRAISFVTVIAMLIAMAMPASIFAGDEEPAALIVSTECLEDGSYFETTIETETTSEPSLFSTRTTVSGSKTVTYKNSNNATMWYVIVHGTFSYSGTSATCTKVTGSMTSKSSNWKVSNLKTSRSGNAATASANGKGYRAGSVVETKTHTVTLKCSAKDNLY